MNDKAAQIAEILLREKAVFLRPHDPFVWTSGIKSPVYCDNRLLISTVDSRNIIVEAFVRAISSLPEKIDCIAGTATAGIPWAAWIAMKMKLPLIYVRGNVKDHGRQNVIEGSAPAGSKIVLIEDLISTGKSSILAAKRLQESGLDVKKIFSIFNYDFMEAQEIFAKAQLPFESLTNFDRLAEVAYQNKILDTNDLENVLKWRKSVVFP